MIDPADLMGSSDIAALFDVVPSSVTNWRHRHPAFPAPVVTVNRGRTPLFSRRAVVAWWRAHHAHLLAAAERLDR